ncbi:MAG: hypothetical protein CMQ40_02325 [Gammaproteobacteria bacterium]|nr:hypothetical protein [Gammaproteobacteria bacterium]
MLKSFFSARYLFLIQSCLLLALFGVFFSPSQSLASYPTYLLAIFAVFSFADWRFVIDDRITILFVMLLGYFLFSASWADETTIRTAGSALVRVTIVFSFVIAVSVLYREKPDNSMFSNVILWTGFLSAILAIFFYGEISADEIRPGRRMIGLGFLENPVFSGLLYSLSFLCAVEKIARARAWKKRILFLFPVLVLGYAIYLCGSVNSFLCLFLSAVVLLGLKKNRLLLVISVFGAATLLLIGVIYFYSPSWETVGSLLPREDSYRFGIWKTVITNIDGWALLFGSGMGTDDNVYYDNQMFLHPHSLYLSIIFETGLLGLLLYGLVFFQVAKALWSAKAREAALILSVLFFGSVSFVFDSHVLVDKIDHKWILLWYPLGVSLGVLGNYKMGR